MKIRAIPALLWCVFFLFPVLAMPSRAHASDWLPVSQQDLAMKDNPKHKGDHAMILWREVQFNEITGTEEFYVRIKVFDEEGGKYGDYVTEAVDPSMVTTGNVRGRTIHPDGLVVLFAGNALDQTVLKYNGARLVDKTIALPSVTPGSILEVRYTINWGVNVLLEHYWQVGSSLFQRKAHFSIRPSMGADFLRWHTVLIPNSQMKLNGSVATLDIEDMPGYEQEPFMPPDSTVIAGVYFYHAAEVLSTDDFWKQEGNEWRHEVEAYKNWLGGAEKRELAAMLSPTDTNLVKLQKIYDRVQSFKNLNYAPEKTLKEIHREKQKYNESIDDIIQRGYGWHNQLNRLFLGLARGAGLDATLVRVPDRSEAYLDKTLLSGGQIFREIVLVRADGKNIYLDPGTRFCPFGVLPWEYTSVIGLQMDKVSPTWVTVPTPDPENARISRKAVLQLQKDGSVQGEVNITFFGHEAMDRRLAERDLDDAGRKKDMEDLLRAWLPANGTVELQKVSDWQTSNLPLVATYQVNIPGYAGVTGRRTILPTAFFGGAYVNPFKASRRTNSIVFPLPYIDADDVTINMAPDLHIESLPNSKSQKNGLGEFLAECKSENGVLHATRQFTLRRISLEAKYYPAVQAFFGQVATTQDEQAVLVKTAK